MEPLALEIEEPKGELSRTREFSNEHLHACPCEHCGQILVRKHMFAPYGRDRGSDGKPLFKSFLWFCGYCVYRACVSLGGNQPEVRGRIGEWLARGMGASSWPRWTRTLLRTAFECGETMDWQHGAELKGDACATRR